MRAIFQKEEISCHCLSVNNGFIHNKVRAMNEIYLEIDELVNTTKNIGQFLYS